DVEPARRRLILVGEQSPEQALLLDRLVAGKPLLQRRKGFRRAALRRIGLDRAGRDEGLVVRTEGGGRGRKHAPFPPQRGGNCKRGIAWRVCAWYPHPALSCPAHAGHPVAPHALSA